MFFLLSPPLIMAYSTKDCPSSRGHPDASAAGTERVSSELANNRRTGNELALPMKRLVLPSASDLGQVEIEVRNGIIG